MNGATRLAWIRKFAARRCNLSGEADLKRHLARGDLVHDSMHLLDPQQAAAMDFAAGPGAASASDIAAPGKTSDSVDVSQAIRPASQPDSLK